MAEQNHEGSPGPGSLVEPEAMPSLVVDCIRYSERVTLPHAVLPLLALAYRDAVARGVGTCFVIGVFDEGRRALAITARHNLDGLAQALVGNDELRRRDRFGLSVINLEDDGQVLSFIPHAVGLAFVQATDIWASPYGDTALLGLKTETGKFECALKLDSTPLSVGEQVTALGHIFKDYSPLPDWVNKIFPAKFELEPLFRGGVVLESHPSGIRRFSSPGFTIDTNFPAGMSGGPVLDALGRVRAVVGGDLALSADDPNPVPGAFATAVWTSMLTTTTVRIGSGEDALPPGVNLAEWVRRGLVSDQTRPDKHIVVAHVGERRELRWINPPPIPDLRIDQVSPMGPLGPLWPRR